VSPALEGSFVLFMCIVGIVGSASLVLLVVLVLEVVTAAVLLAVFEATVLEVGVLTVVVVLASDGRVRAEVVNLGGSPCCPCDEKVVLEMLVVVLEMLKVVVLVDVRVFVVMMSIAPSSPSSS